jgi:PAS domain S-box-containing protein
MQTHADVKSQPKLDTSDQRGVPEIGPLVEHLDVDTVLKVSQAVSGEIALEKVVEVLLRTAIEQAGAERALLIFPRGSELWIQAEAKTHGGSVTVRLNETPVSGAELPESIIRHVARTQEIVILDDASARNPYSTDEYFREQRLRSVLCLPLPKQSTLVALLYLENNIDPNIFAPAKIAVMRVLASAAAISLDNSRLYRELQEREGKIRRLVDANIIGVLISDSEGQIIESNDAFLKMVGYTREELVSGRMCWRNMTPAEWKDASEQGVVQVNATGVCNTFEKEYYRKDGSRVPVLVGAARFEKNSIVAFAIDLTKRKRAEEALQSISRDLQESKAKLEEAQRITHVGYWERDIVSSRTTWSDETYRIFGLQPQERPMDLNAIMQMVHPEDREFVSRTQKEALIAGPRYDFEYRLLRPTGELRIVHAEGYIKKDASGRPYQAFGTVQDITDRKRAEESLRASEAYLADSQKLSRTGSWAWHPEAGITYWSEESYRVQDFDPRDGLPSTEQFFQRIHPDDQPGMMELMQRLSREKIAIDTNFRIVHPSGVVRDIHSTCRPVFNPSGDFIEFIGTMIDVTERKRAEEELRASEQNYRHLVDTTPAFVHTALPNGDLDFFNRGWLEYLGLSITDLLGWRWTSAIHSEDVEELVTKWRAALESGEAFVAEARVRRADGKYRWFLHRKQPQRNEVGKIVKWYGSSIEIEERKIAEEAIRRSEAFLAEAQRLSHTGSFNWNAVTDELTWSDELYRIKGYDRSVTPSFKMVRDRIHPDDRQLWDDAYKKAAQGREVNINHRVLMPDGSVKYMHVTAYGVQKDGKFVELIGTVRDITEQKHAEEAVLRSEAFLAEGQRFSHTGSWGWNASTEKLTWSPEHFRILGLDSQDTTPSLEVFWERVHPDDRDDVRRAFESAIRDKRDFEQEFRIVTPDWSIRHLHGVGHAVLNKANELVEFIGSTMDITERKRAEERAQSYNEAIRVALNAFVKELDVDRFLGHVMTGLIKQFRATFCELWLFDDPIGATSLHLIYQQGKMIETKAVGLQTGKLHTIWQPSNIGRIPRIIEISDQASLLDPTYLELLKEQGVKMLMAVPLVLGEQNLGVVELRFQEATKFTRGDFDLAQALVHHATLALQLSRLAHRTEQMAVTEERNRMAREIHDTLAQAFAGVVLHSEALGTALGVNKSRSKKALSNIQKLARSGLEEARRSVQALRPRALESRTLSQALAQEAKRLSEDGKHSCEFKQKGEVLKLSAEIQNEFFRIAQEAMTNISKHAQAKSVWITLEFKDNQATLTVRDDGIGFAATDYTKPKGGYGLSTMRERALRIGGKLEIESPASGGTVIRVVASLDKKLEPSKHST